MQAGLIEIKKFEIPSSSNPRVMHVIKQWNDGSYSCNCPGWVFKKKSQSRDCAHIRSLCALLGIVTPAAKVAPEPELVEAGPARKFRI